MWFPFADDVPLDDSFDIYGDLSVDMNQEMPYVEVKLIIIARMRSRLVSHKYQKAASSLKAEKRSIRQKYVSTAEYPATSD